MSKHQLNTVCVAIILLLTSFSRERQNKTASINWLTIEQAEILNQKIPKKLVIDIYTDWCGWCKVMDKETYRDPKIIEIINRDFYAVKLNAENQNSIRFLGKTYEFKPEYRCNDLAVQLLQGELSFPNTVFMDEQLKLITAVPGYIKAPEFVHILNYFSSNSYKTTKWDVYRAKQN
ncbi:thioredoxin family protein [Solitalea koreensis]|uniref:Thioredoxin-related protein n=1 Tax=Solitalea koreensis TaxID=543615 RepID=A0A521E1L2_9SPHI|nr:DUF255 domain-containing protein [Solitalea koreensis]SMO77844.1 Thioredoxin-related protein [Solitalea koreensis]